MAVTNQESRSVVLFVRSLSSSDPPTTEHAETVRDLAAVDRVADASISVWGTEVELSNTARRTDAGASILEQVATFRSWARDNDVTMEPFFDTREVNSTVTGESYTALALPVCCLAEYHDDTLVHVAPYCNERAVCSVSDRLRRLNRRVSPDGDATDLARPVAGN